MWYTPPQYLTAKTLWQTDLRTARAVAPVPGLACGDTLFRQMERIGTAPLQESESVFCVYAQGNDVFDCMRLIKRKWV